MDTLLVAEKSKKIIKIESPSLIGRCWSEFGHCHEGAVPPDTVSGMTSRLRATPLRKVEMSGIKTDTEIIRVHLFHEQFQV